VLQGQSVTQFMGHRSSQRTDDHRFGFGEHDTLSGKLSWFEGLKHLPKNSLAAIPETGIITRIEQPPPKHTCRHLQESGSSVDQMG
jgi:hypothetical protein